ncbi:HNH endonuclease signature motif containing protein [Halobacillus andaensis]|uniref:HNH endonuclease signature motif containing protein n=1 Tax=Halobacillus andaensis TaxID=1176239 RepID=UPI003D763F3F
MNPLCEVCLTKNKLTPTDIIHHIIEVKDDWSLRLTLSNCQSVCASCHQALHRSDQ